jgi:hypothetical protein
MKLFIATAGLALTAAALNTATADGPVRQGLRRTGEVAVEGTRRVVEGTGQAVARTGELAADATIRAGQATRNVVGGTINALTPGTPIQARAGANLVADQDRDARWRFARHNNEWWYYTPRGQWMYHRDGDWNRFSEDSFQPLNSDQNLQPMADNQQFAQNEQFSGQHSAGYRGDETLNDQAMRDHGQQHAQQVRTDRHGRQFICENGRPVYLNDAQFSDRIEHQAGYGPPEQPTPADQPAPADQQLNTQQSAAPATANQSSVAGSNDARPNTAAAENASTDPEARRAPDGPQSSREQNNNPDPANDGGSGPASGTDNDASPR